MLACAPLHGRVTNGRKFEREASQQHCTDPCQFFPCSYSYCFGRSPSASKTTPFPVKPTIIDGRLPRLEFDNPVFGGQASPRQRPG
jgi:hypothetical protein